MRTIELSHDYPVSAQRLWELVTDYDALAEVMKGIIKFDGLPSGHTRPGQSFTVMVSVFGVLPPQPYHMEVLECDDRRMVLRSTERGAGVKVWKHSLIVFPMADGSRLMETIEIDAGWLTFAFARWARYLYRARHKPRLRLLTE